MRKLSAAATAAVLAFGLLAAAYPAAADTAADTVIGAILAGGRVTLAESREDLAQNGGAHFVLGNGSGAKETSGEGLVLTAAENENPMFNLDRRLDEAGGVTDGNQAFHIKFKPSAKDFGLMLAAGNSAGITIGGESEPLVFAGMGAYMEPMSGNLRVEPGQWYHALLAMRSDGTLQAAIWKDGEERDLAGCYVSIGDAFGDGEYRNKSWELSIGFRGAAAFTVDSYEYYTFAGFVMDFRSIGGGPEQGGEYGPPWSVNIAGNFDIMSDLVWQSVAPQTIRAGGETAFTGYSLAELMSFSGNGSDRARVVFGQEGAEAALVEPTYDAYIVYMRDGEFLGGPYLLSAGGLSEYPVAEVHPE